MDIEIVWVGRGSVRAIICIYCCSRSLSLWIGVDRKSIGKLCAHYWQQVPHERQTDRQTCKIEDTDSELDLNSEFKAAQCQQTFVVSAQQVLFAESREQIIHNKLLYGVCSIQYYIVYIPRWNQLSSRREIALRMDCQALTCWMLMNGTCELHSFFSLSMNLNEGNWVLEFGIDILQYLKDIWHIYIRFFLYKIQEKFGIHTLSSLWNR